jgi:hypothetical protein
MPQQEQEQQQLEIEQVEAEGGTGSGSKKKHYGGLKLASERGVAGDGDAGLTVHSPRTARSETGSDRTEEELGREMSAKSMG